jgi:ribosomal protein L15E
MVVVVVRMARVIRPVILGSIMRVVVPMLVQRQSALRAKPEQSAVFWRCRHHAGCALATDVVIQANHPVTCSHNNVQIVADHQHACPRIAPHLCDQGVKRSLTWLI